MTKRISALILISANLLTACAQTPVTRHDTSAETVTLLAFADTRYQEDIVARQAIALNDLSDGILRASTIRGAKIGAAVGCGLALVTAANAHNCVAGAVAGGVVGAVAGHKAGQRKVAKKVEFVSANNLVRSIRKTNTTLAAFTTSLPALLAAQDQELEKMSFDRDMGTMSQSAYEKRYNQIKNHRVALALQLSESADKATLAQSNISEASTKGQIGLDWHLGATSRIAKQAHSARSNISLL